MKTLNDYFSAAESTFDRPRSGDVFEFEVARDEMLISGMIAESTNDSITVELDDRGFALLESYYKFDDAETKDGRIVDVNVELDYNDDELVDMRAIEVGTGKDIVDQLTNASRRDAMHFWQEKAQEERASNVTGDEWENARDLERQGYYREDFKAHREKKRMLELAGISKPQVDEGAMKDLDIDLQEIANNEDYDKIYDGLVGREGPALQDYLEKMYTRISIDNGYHPDDGYEEIMQVMMDQIIDEFGDRDIKEGSNEIIDNIDPMVRKQLSDPRVLSNITKYPELIRELNRLADETGYDMTSILRRLTKHSTVHEAEYQGRKVSLGKPMRGDVKKFKVYVKNPKGNVVKVNFGDPNMKIKKSDPARRRSFRARHNCDNPGPRHKARYWSCRKW